MKFLIRDDDLNYFSKPSDIERWFADIFEQDISVGFAAIPFVKSASDVYPFFPETISTPIVDREYRIGESIELIQHVKNNPLIEILQHGCTHETKNGIFEYQQERDLSEDTIRGKKELERAFGCDVKVFVPPHDWIGNQGIVAVEAAQMNIIRGRGAGLRNFILRPQYISIFFRMLTYKFWHSLRGKIPAYPYVLDFGLHKEACSYRLEDQDVFAGLEYAHKKNGSFIVVSHLHTFDDEKKERLMRLIARARELGAEFARSSSLF